MLFLVACTLGPRLLRFSLRALAWLAPVSPQRLRGRFATGVVRVDVRRTVTGLSQFLLVRTDTDVAPVASSV